MGDAPNLDREEWLRRCATEYRLVGGLSEQDATEFAQMIYGEARNGSPEAAAQSDIDFWE